MKDIAKAINATELPLDVQRRVVEKRKKSKSVVVRDMWRCWVVWTYDEWAAKKNVTWAIPHEWYLVVGRTDFDEAGET